MNRPHEVDEGGLERTGRGPASHDTPHGEPTYRQMVEALHEGIWVIDQDNLTTYVNARMAEMLGYTEADMLGAHLFSFMDERGVEICKRHLHRRRKGIHEDHEFELLRKDGTRIFTLMHTSPITGDDGEYRGALAGVLDITRRKEAEESLRRAHADLEERVGEQTRELREALSQLARLKDQLRSENLYLREEIKGSVAVDDIVGKSVALRRVMNQVEQVAETDASVLILGETGTGKELIAHAVHANSPRRNKPLIKINCGALPAGLIESELFGHERGAFTGALGVKVGRFELADGGTILLDEIGDLPLELQPKLLRVLQDGCFERVGSTVTQKTNVRVIAATHRDLEKEVAEGGFRADLYFRLSVFPITLPPLRERREDIPQLVWYFISKLQTEIGKQLTQVPSRVMDALVSYDWPGNIRELANVIERALILSPGSSLVLAESFHRSSDPAEPPPETRTNLNDVEREHITAVLEQCNWRVKGAGNAAEQLGMRPSTLRDRMKKLGIRRPVA